MNKKIFITREIPEVGIKMLREKGYEIDINKKDRVMSPRELMRALAKKQYDAVLCLLTDKIGTDIFKAVPSAKIFANYADGYNNIDINEAKKHGVTITNTPGVCSNAVAEHTVALMMALATRIVEADSYVRHGKYKGWSPMKFMGTDLTGKTIGLIGVGHIGTKTAQIMKKGFATNIIYYDIIQNAEIEQTCGAVRKETVEDVLREADFVSLHVPLLDSTHHLINESRLGIMKPTAFLINTSRGAVIDEKALVKALEQKKIAGAGLDVFEFEPKLTKGLVKLSNVVLTPHIGSAYESTRNAMAKMAAQDIIDFLENKIPKNKIV